MTIDPTAMRRASLRFGAVGAVTAVSTAVWR